MPVYYEDKVYVIEFKCHQSARKAIEQITEKDYTDKWIGGERRVILIGINFDPEKRQIKEMKVVPKNI